MKNNVQGLTNCMHGDKRACNVHAKCLQRGYRVTRLRAGKLIKTPLDSTPVLR